MDGHDTVTLAPKILPDVSEDEKLTPDQPKIIKKKAKRRLDFGSSSYKQRKKKRPNQPSANKTKIQEDSTETRASTKVEGQDSEAFCEPSRGIEVTPNKNSQEKKATDLEETGLVYLPGELVWGKLKGYDWWPGRIISAVESCRGPPNDGNQWIKWFGDNKLSQLSKSHITPFGDFKGKFVPSKMRGMYKRAVYLALEMAVQRCQQSFGRADLQMLPQKHKPKLKQSQKRDAEQRAGPTGDGEVLTDGELQSVMINWAINDFQPTGPQGFAPKADDVDSPQSLPVPTDVKAEENRAGQERARFGKPVNPPSLAQPIKALFDEVAAGKRDIEAICLACGDLRVVTKHPLFHGGLCKECKQTFMECSYLFDEDGSQMYCTVCGDGKEVFMCDNTGCYRSYCGLCIEMLCGDGAVMKIGYLDQWTCHMCTGRRQRLLRRRQNWQEQLKQFFIDDNEAEFDPLPVYPPISPEDRKPIKVLALFDGIAAGLQALKELGIQVDVYYAAEIDMQAVQVAKVHHGDTIQHLGDVEYLHEKHIRKLGPFDLVIGGSPCNDLSIANPIRRGIFNGSGRLFFEFFRLMMFARPTDFSERPFFWLFENVVGMRALDKRTITRYLQCNPVVVDAVDISPAHRARYFWGNAPGMTRPAVALPGDKLTLQECLEPSCGRNARFAKVQTITTNANSMRQTKKGLLPVEVSGKDAPDNEDVLWCTEMERLFGFPSHYTDVGNMGRGQRQRLLGSSWSVPVIRHLLSPLKDYFRCEA